MLKVLAYPVHEGIHVHVSIHVISPVFLVMCMCVHAFTPRDGDASDFDFRNQHVFVECGNHEYRCVSRQIGLVSGYRKHFCIFSYPT